MCQIRIFSEIILNVFYFSCECFPFANPDPGVGVQGIWRNLLLELWVERGDYFCQGEADIKHVVETGAKLKVP